MNLTIAIIIGLSTLNSYGKECEISGKAILWAYDSCFWEYGTDDSIHPGVLKCVEKAGKLIESVGSCEAKRKFKQKICNIAKTNATVEINPKTCMNEDKALGPAVRDGGI